MKFRSVYFILLLFLLAGCVMPTAVSNKHYENFMMASHVLDRVSMEMIKPGEKILLVSEVAAPSSAFGAYDASGTLQHYQYIRHGVINSLLKKGVSVIEPQKTTKETKAFAVCDRYLPSTSMFLMNNWKKLKKDYAFDKVLEYKLEKYDQVGSQDSNGWGAIIHVILYAADGSIITSNRVASFSTGFVEAEKGKVLENSGYEIHNTVRDAVKRTLTGKLSIKNALVVYNGLEAKSEFAGGLAGSDFAALWKDQIRHSNMGIISALTELKPSSVKLVTKRIFKKRSWQKKAHGGVNRLPILIKENWKEFATEAEADYLVSYRFIASNTETETYLSDLNSTGMTEKNMKMLLRIVNMKKDGKIEWIGTVPLFTADTSEGKTPEPYKMETVYDSGLEYGQMLARSVEKQTSMKEKTYLWMMDFDPLMAYRSMKKRPYSENEAVFDDGLTTGLFGSGKISLTEAGRSFFHRCIPKNYSKALEINTVKYLNEDSVLTENINKVIYYYLADRINTGSGMGATSDKPQIASLGFKLVDTHSKLVLKSDVLSR